jgi:plasmid stability protein
MTPKEGHMHSTASERAVVSVVSEVPPETKAVLVIKAKKADRSLLAEIRRALRAWLELDQSEPAS